ncbi:MAG TPA: hypothetical protein VKB76_11335 [Ktedonobacterales bacterium]|nr:hypothetical protein [Ktedonobacterales bacterium]
MSQHLYAPMYRPAHGSALPEGVTWEYFRVPLDMAHLRPDVPLAAREHRFGVIALSRKLTADEMSRFEMKEID